MKPLRSMAAALAAAACCAFASPARADEPLHVVNVMPAFWNAWDRGAGKPLDERVRLFETLVLYPNRAAYDSSQFRLDETHLAWYLIDVEPQIPQMRKLTETLAAQLPGYERSFAAAFPDLKPVTVYFLPSLLHFDGQSRNGVLFFGVDGIAKFDGPNSNLGALISHELFHVYHAQVNPSTFGESGTSASATVAQQLWSEGLATYVSAKLNPGATRAQALFSADLAALAPPKTQQLACAMQPKLGSARDADATPFFDAGENPPGLPPRGGYLIGMLVAEDLGKTRSLRELARLSGAPLNRAIEQHVARLCSATVKTAT